MDPDIIHIAGTEPKPAWLKIKIRYGESYPRIKEILRSKGLVTVCEEAHCPNINECWAGHGTATFMVLGDICTRGCRFCNIKTSRKGQSVDRDEPRKLAESVAEMNLKYAVITSVDRDDLEDEGAGHFAACVRAIREARPTTLIETLIPDFSGRRELISLLCAAGPDVIAHNIETVERLQGKVRDRRANYAQSLAVIRAINDGNAKIIAKTGLMVGMGETSEEVVRSMQDAFDAGARILTIGQYLKPSSRHYPLHSYIAPEQFKHYKREGERMGYLYVAAGPFVRSSYRAAELYVDALKRESMRNANTI
ncbi:MAG: lipoyl synthase [Nanoarchaeota archaeon]